MIGLMLSILCPEIFTFEYSLTILSEKRSKAYTWYGARVSEEKPLNCAKNEQNYSALLNYFARGVEISG